MDKNEAIEMVANLLQSVYSKQSRESHEILAECIVDQFIEHNVLNVTVPEYRDYLYRARAFIIKESRRCLNKDYLLSICNQEQESQSLQSLQQQLKILEFLEPPDVHRLG